MNRLNKATMENLYYKINDYKALEADNIRHEETRQKSLKQFADWPERIEFTKEYHNEAISRNNKEMKSLKKEIETLKEEAMINLGNI